MKTKDNTLLEEAYDTIQENGSWEGGRYVLASTKDDRIARLSHHLRTCITAIEDITDETGFEGLPETKQKHVLQVIGDAKKVLGVIN